MKNLLVLTITTVTIGLSACSSPSATICGLEVREGEKTKIRANQEILTALKNMDSASNKSSASGSPSFITINGDSNVLSVLPLFRSAGLGSDGNSIILRNAKAYQESLGGVVLLELSCEKQ
jgi:hypothetical protein